MIKIIDNIDIAPLLDCYRQIEPKISWTDYGHKGRQASLQQFPGEQPWISGVGKNNGRNDLDYQELNTDIVGTIFETVIKKYQLSRTRLMWVGPYACYSMHRDLTPRIHVPLITNTECYFLFRHMTPNHLAAGHVYVTDTRHQHTFVNCWDQSRLHLVGAIDPQDHGLPLWPNKNPTIYPEMPTRG